MNLNYTFLRNLESKELVTGIMIFEFFNPGLPKILKECGADFVIYDTEHSGVGIETIKMMVAAGRELDLYPIVRVPSLDQNSISQYLDAGIKGIMVPNVKSAEEAKQIVKLAKYRPVGERGIAFNVAHDYYSPNDPKKKLQEANSSNILIAMIESEEGVENCKEILSVEGIDMGWLGHFDLTDSLRVLGDFEHELFTKSIEKVSKASKIANKPLGFLDINQPMLAQFRELGFSVLGYGHEVLVFQKALKDGIEMIKHLK
jgi:2-dehydro-3-deoxyglucarate aldolase/4-hydroxy-2-oxoheptanedioate aldolase